MGKTAFIFPGQGAQESGMGAGLYKESKIAREIFELSDAIRPGTLKMCLEGSSEELSLTENTQPCLFTTELAAAAALYENNIRADMCAGFSLGELSALCCAHMLSGEDFLNDSKGQHFEAIFRLVTKRGKLMQLAAEKNPAKMAAVLKLSDDEVTKLCQEKKDAYPVNFNCPGQVTVSAAAEAMDILSESVKEAGGRLVPLKVSGGFHSPFMREAAEEFRKIAAEAKLCIPELAVYANLTAEPYGAIDVLHDEQETRDHDGDMSSESETMAYMLSRQIVSPVLWEKTIRGMIRDGADTFIEVGPGATLSGMVKRIDRDVRVLSAFDEDVLKGQI